MHNSEVEEYSFVLSALEVGKKTQKPPPLQKKKKSACQHCTLDILNCRQENSEVFLYMLVFLTKVLVGFAPIGKSSDHNVSNKQALSNTSKTSNGRNKELKLPILQIIFQCFQSVFHLFLSFLMLVFKITYQYQTL